MKKFFDTFLNKMGKEKISIVVLIGILLLVISLPVKKDSTSDGQDTQQKAAQSVSAEGIDGAEYETYIEKKLENILAQVEGVGKVNVVVTVKSSGEKILAADESYSQEQLEETDSAGGSRRQNTQSGSTSNIFYDSAQGSQPYVKLENMPQIEGIMIVAQGGGDKTVAANLTSAVEALLGVPAHKIKVLKMS